NEKADRIIREAGKKAEFLISDAKNAISREQNILMQMKKEAAKFKSELFETYKSHIELISRISDYDIDNEKTSNKKEIKQQTTETNEQLQTQEQSEVSLDDINEQAVDTVVTEEINEIVFDEQSEEISEEAMDAVAQAKYEELKFGENYDAFYDNSSKKSSSKGSFLKRKNR
ncbi:MAG: hypothetical protein RSC41_05170, partial [Oscillospiraceae bacterium]